MAEQWATGGKIEPAEDRADLIIALNPCACVVLSPEIRERTKRILEEINRTGKIPTIQPEVL